MSLEPRYWVQYTQILKEAGKPDTKEECVAGFVRNAPISTFADIELLVQNLRGAVLQNNPHIDGKNLSIIVRSWQRFEDSSHIIVPTAVPHR